VSLSEIFWLPGGPWPSEKMEGYMQRTAKAPVGSRAERWVAAMMLITAVASVGCAELLDVLDPPGEGFLDVFMQIDGDPAGQTPMRAESVPAAMRVLVPATAVPLPDAGPVRKGP